MKRLLHSRPVDRALRGAALVVTDRRWAAPLSAAALGFGVFAGVAIGPGTAGTLATGAPQIVEVPSLGRDQGQSGGGGGAAAPTESAPLETAAGGGFEEALPAPVPLAAAPVEPAPAPQAAAKPVPADEGGEGEEAAAPGEQSLAGAVVHVNRAAGSYTLAIKGGELVSVHAPDLPEPGTKLTALVRRLANGAFAEAGDPEAGQRPAKQASFRGSVTFTDPDPEGPAYTVSGRGASLLVKVKPDPSGVTPELPEIGAYATVTATLNDGLWQRQVELEPGPPSTYLDLAGIVKGVDADTAQLLFSADDTDESEADLTLTVPKSIDATKLKPGDSYLATATVNEVGSLKLAGITSDEHTKGANDPALAQGDLKR